MPAPLDTIKRNPLLHQLPERTQLPQKTHALRHRLQHIINLLLRRETAEAKSDTAVRTFVAVAQSAQDVARLERGGCARAPRRESDVFESHEERFAFHVGERYVDAAWVEVFGGAVLGGMFEAEEAFKEAGGEFADTLGIILFVMMMMVSGL